jgi:hypothetical protein
VTLDGNIVQGGNGAVGGSGGTGTGAAGAGGTADGGGIFLACNSGPKNAMSGTLTNCTVQGNSALGGFGPQGSGTEASGQGGGLDIALIDVTAFLDAATVAQITGNTASDGSAFDNIVGPYTLV